MAKKSRFPGPKMMSSKESGCCRRPASHPRHRSLPHRWRLLYDYVERLFQGAGAAKPLTPETAASASDVLGCLSRTDDDTPVVFASVDCSRPNDDDPGRDKTQTYGTSYRYGRLVDQLQPSQHPSSMPCRVVDMSPSHEMSPSKENVGRYAKLSA